MQPPSAAKPTKRRWLLLLILLLAAAEFVVRGPVRYHLEGYDWNDLTQVYTPSRAWLLGMNPYDPASFIQLWKSQTGQELGPESIKSHAAYPLTTLVVMSPLAALPWQLAEKVWTAVRLLLLPLMIGCLSRVAGLDRDHALAFAAMTLALAPLHTGMATGNVTILAVELLAVALWAINLGRSVLGGCTLALATCVKPQIAVCVLAYYLLRGACAVVLAALATGSTVLAIGILRLHALGTGWIGDFLRNGRDFVRASHVDDFSWANPIRFTLINLQVPFLDITGSRTAANGLAFLVGAALATIWLWLCVRAKNRPDVLLETGSLSLISLLAVYHRFYDATLLVLPLCWTLSARGWNRPRLRWGVWLLCVPFLAPGTAALQNMVAARQIPDSIARSRLWTLLVMPHETWSLLALTVILLAAIWTQSAADTGIEDTARGPSFQA